jgi:hypothetical protein
MGLRETTFSERLLNFYPNQKDTYNPCTGLMEWSAGNENQYLFVPYARYWHGHSEILRWLTLFFGVAVTRALLATLLIGLYFLLGFQIYKLLKSKIPFVIQTTLTALLGAFYFSGSIDLQNSMTHLLSEISLILIAIVSLKILLNEKRNALVWGFSIGGVYVTTSYMINPQSIPVVIISWALIPILISNGIHRIQTFNLWKRFANLIVGVGAGYLSLWVTKWVLIDLLTSFPIWDDVRSQAAHRSSQSVSDLSAGVSTHLEFAANLPASLQAIVANLTALGIKIWDPRFGSITGPLLLSVVVLLGILLMNRRLNEFGAINSEKIVNSSKQIAAANVLSLSILLTWYSFMAQHSFDHATYTYRSLAYFVSGLVFSIMVSISLKKTLRDEHEA